MKTSILERLLKETDNDIINEVINNIDVEVITKVLNNIDEGKLYKGNHIHGIEHSERVFLYAYLISKNTLLNELDLKIIYDAAIYHDCGRINDCEDTFHGLISARKANDFITEGIYKDPANKALLKAIIDGHSRKDEEYENIYTDYFGEDEKYYMRFQRLLNILKDADALDRTRFWHSAGSYLNENLLRTKKSKEIIEFSKKIIENYNMKKNNYEDHLHMLETYEDIFVQHSVGVDIAKMSLIIQNGILSKTEMHRTGIKGMANYLGGNGLDWISLCKCERLSDDTSSYMKYITEGISFLCFVPKAYGSLKNKHKSSALSASLPYDHMGLSDEIYVMNKVPTENILGITIKEEVAKTKITDLKIINLTLSYDILHARILSLSKRYGFHINLFKDIFKERHTLDAQYNSCWENEQRGCFCSGDVKKDKEETMRELLNQVNVVNKRISFILKSYYQKKLNKEDITLIDLIEHEFELLNLEYIREENSGNIYFSMNNVKTKQKIIKNA